MDSSPAPDLIQRFAADCAAIWPEGAKPEAQLGLAVSGGPDSLALLLLAHAAMPGCIEAATVDHQLRPGSKAEAEAVAAICQTLAVPHAILAVDVAPGNLQAQARTARYAALAGWLGERGLAALASGHHADDQAETLLARLNRASGVAGLAGVRARGLVPGTDIPLLRPLLGWRRAELGEVVASAGIVAAQDPSNCDPRFDRVRLRQALVDADWLDVPALAASAAHLADADMALDWAANREWAERVVREGLGVTYRPRAPRAIALKVLERIVRDMGEGEVRGSALARLFDSLRARQPMSIGKLVARATPAGWSFTRAPQRRG